MYIYVRVKKILMFINFLIGVKMRKTAKIELSMLTNIDGIESTSCASIIYRRDTKTGFLVRKEHSDTLIPKCVNWLKNNGYTHYKINGKAVSI